MLLLWTLTAVSVQSFAEQDTGHISADIERGAPPVVQTPGSNSISFEAISRDAVSGTNVPSEDEYTELLSSWRRSLSYFPTASQVDPTASQVDPTPSPVDPIYPAVESNLSAAEPNPFEVDHNPSVIDHNPSVIDSNITSASPNSSLTNQPNPSNQPAPSNDQSATKTVPMSPSTETKEADESCSKETYEKDGPGSKPNIVLVVLDDFGWEDWGFHGYNISLTPTVDHLARKYAVMDQFYTQALCSPSRAAIFTGVSEYDENLSFKLL